MSPSASRPRVLGRYAVYRQIASGGMAAVHLGRMRGAVGFSRIVAIKRLHSQYSADADFVSMFLDEARLTGRIRHPNVVSTLDAVAMGDELFLVMEYVHGEALSRLCSALHQREERIPPWIAAAIMVDVLHGLHAAHEATDEHGLSLNIVHRDVSPQNILIGTDGVARVLDFGIAKARGRHAETRDGQLKGKLAYMAPEQLRGEAINARTDLFAAAIVLWELLTGQRLFRGESEGETLTKVLLDRIPLPSEIVPELTGFDELMARGLARTMDDRFESAREMAQALELASPIAGPSEVGDWVRRVAAGSLAERAQIVGDIERDPSDPVEDEGSASVRSIASRRQVGADEITDPASSEGSALTATATSVTTVARRSRRVGYVLGVGGLAIGFAAAVGMNVRRGPTEPAAQPLPSAEEAKTPVPKASGSGSEIASPTPSTTTTTTTIAATPQVPSAAKASSSRAATSTTRSTTTTTTTPAKKDIRPAAGTKPPTAAGASHDPLENRD